MRRLVLLVLLGLLFAGCLKPTARLGCCLEENLSDGCVLYNTTSGEAAFSALPVNGLCDDPDSNTTGHCNVTMGNETYLIPICTENKLVPCLQPNCTAMVCGDFKYSPRVSPAFFSVEESAGEVPPNVEEEAAANFYKARCDFLPMDKDLSKIMKNSRSQINVFRTGVGGSFDEYDQYRYFFPMSDQFCNINPSQEPGDLRVDRYMNYLGPGGEAFEPLEEITENCLDDSDIPEPFGFSESGATKSSKLDGKNFDYTPVVPDRSNYNFSHYARLDLWSDWESSGDYYKYGDKFVSQTSVHKKIDKEFYRRELSIAHASTIYGIGPAETTRAPFECDVAGYDCYSGTCDTTVYNRGVLLGYAENPGEGSEVVADCNKITDANDITRVVCAPTRSITVTSPGNPPNVNYARVVAIPSHMESTDAKNPWYKYTSFAKNQSLLDEFWVGFSDTDYAAESYEGASRTMTNTLSDSGMYFEYVQKKYCPQDYGENDDESLVWCSNMEEATEGPPAAGITFFGKPGDKEVRYGGETIIGYAVASPADFQNMLFVKGCNIDTDEVAAFPPPPDPDWYGEQPELRNVCIFTCEDLCPTTPDITTKCAAYCDGNGTVAPPCTPPSTDLPRETDDYLRIELSGPDDPNWGELMAAFKPYFQEMSGAMTLEGFADGCGKRINAYDPVVSAMPWVINHDKGARTTTWYLGEVEEVEFLTSISGQALRQRNTYDEPMVDHSKDTSSCELRRSAMPWNPMVGFGFPYRSYYNVLFSKYIYIFKYEPGSRKMGDCAVDDNSFLPEVRTYGWCEPCTTSTLAYQEITAYDRVYMPAKTGNVEGSTATDVETICEAEYDYEWRQLFDLDVTDNVSCFHPAITDIGEYQESIGGIGSPRTKPEASVLKERLGNYMKSGVLPVIDMSHDSNWNITNPDGDIPGFWLFWWTDPSSPDEYLEYDFERLFGNMGASVVIVEHISGDATAEQAERIANRSSILKDNCFGCLAAFHVDNPASNESFNDSLNSVFTQEPWAYYYVDMVTFDYPASKHLSTLFGGEMVASEIATYSRTSLQNWGKPTMVVGLNIQNSPTWTSEDYEKLFSDIVAEQDELVKAGVTGIIYSPVRTGASSGPGSEGLVQLDGAGVGSKGAKFCAFQQAVEKSTSKPAVAMFTKTAALDAVECTPCTSLDILQGTCDLTCDNGALCDPPDGMSHSDAEGGYKCPDGVVVKTCQLCNETGGTFSCTKTYTNGTVEPIDGSMSEVSSDLYLDVVGGIPKPDKCCLWDELANTSYTYIKEAYPTAMNKPIVFPETGDPNVDCGFGSPGAVTELTTFCGMPYSPLKEYDIECTTG